MWEDWGGRWTKQFIANSGGKPGLLHSEIMVPAGRGWEKSRSFIWMSWSGTTCPHPLSSPHSLLTFSKLGSTSILLSLPPTPWSLRILFLTAMLLARNLLGASGVNSETGARRGGQGETEGRQPTPDWQLAFPEARQLAQETGLGGFRASGSPTPAQQHGKSLWRGSPWVQSPACVLGQLEPGTAGRRRARFKDRKAGEQPPRAWVSMQVKSAVTSSWWPSPTNILPCVPAQPAAPLPGSWYHHFLPGEAFPGHPA